MRSRTVVRKTVRTTSVPRQRKPVKQKVGAGQRIKITGGKFSGRVTEIVKVTKEGVIVAVVTTVKKSLRRIGSRVTESLTAGHRVMLIRHGSFELKPILKSQSQHRGMSWKKRRIVLGKLKELNQLKQRLAFLKSKRRHSNREADEQVDILPKRIKQLQKELRNI